MWFKYSNKCITIFKHDFVQKVLSLFYWLIDTLLLKQDFYLKSYVAVVFLIGFSCWRLIFMFFWVELLCYFIFRNLVKNYSTRFLMFFLDQFPKYRKYIYIVLIKRLMFKITKMNILPTTYPNKNVTWGI